MVLQDAPNHSHCEKTVSNFAHTEKGLFVLLTDDQSFIKTFRALMGKELGLIISDVLLVVQDSGKLIKLLKDAERRGRRPFLIMERVFKSRDMSHTVRQIKEILPHLLVLVLTVEVERKCIFYLHESGVDNFIAKPVSMQTMAEKLAFTIEPHKLLGRAIVEAKALLTHGEAEKARAAAEDILCMKPGSAAGLIVLGDAQRALGELDAAEASYKLAAENAELYLEPLRRLAALCEEKGNLEECLVWLERMDRLSPLNTERKVSMGEIHLNLGNEEKAAGLFESAIEQAAKETRELISTLAERIAGVYAEKNPERSEFYLRKALNMKKDRTDFGDVRVFNMLGLHLRRQGKWLDAAAEYRRALNIAPRDPGLHYNLGMAYVQGERMHDARLCMEKAVDLDRDFPRSSDAVAFNMGCVFMRGGLMDMARSCFEASLSLNPENEKAAVELAKLYPRAQAGSM
ncbi:MAG: tetratricopeptide repeat protein [Desulfovibrio sp.]|jgi:tetratricopeptide (TPR) repeat protein|nr:tetratricopeptide repeat protein [Desulfovibrio sp.]